MKWPKSYVFAGFLSGIIAGILLSLLGILVVYACNFAFNPGGIDIPPGICETISTIYLPILILFMFVPFGTVGFVLPPVIMIIICALLGVFLGWLIERRQKKVGLSILTKKIIKVTTAIFYLLIFISIISVSFVRKEHLFSHIAKYQAYKKLRKETFFLRPTYLPTGLKYLPIDNEIGKGHYQAIYCCNNDTPKSYSLKISAHILDDKHQAAYSKAVWRTRPKYGYRREEVKIGNQRGYFSYYDQNTSVDNRDFEKWIKPSRSLSWRSGKFYIRIDNKRNAACVYPKDELIKIAESMKQQH